MPEMKKEKILSTVLAHLNLSMNVELLVKMGERWQRWSWDINVGRVQLSSLEEPGFLRERCMLQTSECKATLSALTSFAEDEPLWELNTGSRLSRPSVMAPRHSIWGIASAVRKMCFN